MLLRNLLLDYLSLGAIVSPLPNNIIDGQAVDAVPVMANFNWIVSQVNANAASTSAVTSAIAAAIATVGTTVGSWTPALAFGGAATGITYNLQAGHYITIGDIVFYWAALQLTSKGSSTGLATITGLPVAINTNSSGLPSGSVPIGLMNMNSVNFATGSGTASWFTLTPLALGGTTLFIDGNVSSVVGAGLPDTSFANGSTLYMSGFYPS